MRIGPSYTLVVSRTCVHLYASVITALRDQPEIRVVIDRRYRARRQGLRAVGGERRQEERRRGMDMLLV
jgi:hypothetical protein